MHIVLVTDTYPPDNGWGGIGSYVYHMSRGLTALGHRVTVVCGFGKHPRYSWEDGVRALRVIDTRPDAAVHPAAQVRTVLERLVASDSVDIIECPEYGGLGLDFQRAAPTFPVVVKLHGDTESCLYGDAPTWKRVAYRFYVPEPTKRAFARERESVARAHLVIAPSRWFLNRCLQRNWPVGRRAMVVPNPFYASPPIVQDVPARRNPAHVLWLARLDRSKGAELLPGIASEVWAGVPDAQFHIIGQQRYNGRQPWIDWIRHRVPAEHRAKMVYLGGLPYLEVANRLRAYSIAVFASTWETFSYAQLECMWAGLACVSASVGGPDELGINGESQLRTTRAPRAIACQIRHLLQNPTRTHQIGCAARAHVRARFNSELVAGRMATAYAAAQAQASIGAVHL